MSWRCRRSGRRVALRLLHAGDALVHDREIALPLRVPGIGFREAFGYGEAVIIGSQRGFKIALRLLHDAELVIGHGEIALPEGTGSDVARREIMFRFSS